MTPDGILFVLPGLGGLVLGALMATSVMCLVRRRPRRRRNRHLFLVADRQRRSRQGSTHG